ncbi:MAG TPA: hypothetical protein VIJ87_09045, partial [Pyrinomonadaceae bacterium]
MAYVIYTPNAFEPAKSEKHIVEAGISVREWVKSFLRAPDFDHPTICVVNGDPLLRAGWDYLLKPDDVVNFLTLPGCPATWIAIISIVITIVMLGVTLLMSTPTPTTPGEAPASDPVYTIKGQANSIRLAEPIECNYGRNRVYPSYAARPYYEYRDNDQYQFSLFCLGQGEYEIEEIKIGDTLLSNFQEVQYEVIPPAGQVTIFPTNVYTSA